MSFYAPFEIRFQQLRKLVVLADSYFMNSPGDILAESYPLVWLILIVAFSLPYETVAPTYLREKMFKFAEE